MGIMVGIGKVGDCIRHIVHDFSLFDIDEWCGNHSFMSVIEINHLDGFYLFSVVGAGLVDFFPF